MHPGSAALTCLCKGADRSAITCSIAQPHQHHLGTACYVCESVFVSICVYTLRLALRHTGTQTYLGWWPWRRKGRMGVIFLTLVVFSQVPLWAALQCLYCVMPLNPCISPDFCAGERCRRITIENWCTIHCFQLKAISLSFKDSANYCHVVNIITDIAVIWLCQNVRSTVPVNWKKRIGGLTILMCWNTAQSCTEMRTNSKK